MATKNRIFIAFAVEDKTSRDFLVGQAKNEKSPFEFVNMSVNEPWDEEWKKQCRSRIKGCDGMIALVSKDTAKATGELWEVKTAKEENVAVRGMYCTADNRPATLPNEFTGVRIMSWSWPNIVAFLDSLKGANVTPSAYCRDKQLWRAVARSPCRCRRRPSDGRSPFAA